MNIQKALQIVFESELYIVPLKYLEIWEKKKNTKNTTTLDILDFTSDGVFRYATKVGGKIKLIKPENGDGYMKISIIESQKKIGEHDWNPSIHELLKDDWFVVDFKEAEKISDINGSFPLSHSLLEHSHDLPTDGENENIKKLEQEKTEEMSNKMEVSEHTFKQFQHTHHIPLSNSYSYDMTHSVPIDVIVNQNIQEEREKKLKETEEVKEILLKQLRKLSNLSDEKETDILSFCYPKQFPELTAAISELATKLRMYL